MALFGQKQTDSNDVVSDSFWLCGSKALVYF